MTAASVMTSDHLQTLNEHLAVDVAGEMMAWQSIRHVPVVDDAGRVVGLITHRDLLRLAARGETGRLAAEVMTPVRLTFRPETPLKVIIEAMITRKWGCALITDDDRHLLGILTEADFLHIVYGML
ncbi:MAG: hypothetical protein COW73_02945 [Nitrospirae bacterium CG18_big_fil_WC_8_21_14_2_50_70_55]|nr:CBS domain-containing protein [Deltaproteobacteria bacterium]OIP63282.1 MAG: hypothetical protein AUK30_08715 [Nitrospirae bacterium CG2_30_70_394]PIQ06648.1 MAG: hypothetical protein COW73_02945 [Nitrospirae bacterium CG18_big_fil_WC_8_21_14_2_50_70_55]PIU78430.1 MAG: hypothetical protein COS73_07255 [Nitrospirae bacterium CG06_land_8_20_14_3_00_70_43]PIW84043.1 MAG: hypothetical protein COZ96_00235 [Nitrospirae bacterium CG_4_8_14_3_um_filter_70_85]PIX84174.1 MAG: hypothetical protein COZ